MAGWLTDVSAATGGRINGLKPVRTLAELIDVTSLVVFTASAQHAAVNFPQFDFMSYAPAMPLAGYAPAATSKRGRAKANTWLICRRPYPFMLPSGLPESINIQIDDVVEELAHWLR